MNTNALVKVAPAPVVNMWTAASAALVESFFDGRNERTIRAYRQDLEDFRAFLKVGTVEEATRLLFSGSHGEANGLALAYKADLVKRGLQAATVNRRLAALRSIVKLARTLGMVSWSLEVENLKTEPYRDTRGPGDDGYLRLLHASHGQRNERLRQRDTAILHLLHDIVLRRGEVVGLDVEDLDLSAGTVSILGKGRTQRETLTLPEPTKDALRAWLEVRGMEPGPLFVNYDHAGKGKRLTGTSVYRIVEGLGKTVGLKTRPHGLRHTGITKAIRVAQANGMDLEEVLDFSRHKDVKVLMVYRDRERNVQGKLASLVAVTA